MIIGAGEGEAEGGFEGGKGFVRMAALAGGAQVAVGIGDLGEVAEVEVLEEGPEVRVIFHGPVIAAEGGRIFIPPSGRGPVWQFRQAGLFRGGGDVDGEPRCSLLRLWQR